MKFNQQQKELIKQAILHAEKSTNGEIVPVIVRRSDLYPAANFRCSLLVSFLFTLGCYLLENKYSYGAEVFLYSFIVGIIVGFFICYFEAIKKFFISKEEMNEEFRQKALESFLINGVSETTNRNGVQIFISVFEKKAMITTDIGLQELINNEVWKKIIEKLILKLKDGLYTEGIIEVIKEVGVILQNHYPATHENTDLLPNKLIIE